MMVQVYKFKAYDVHHCAAPLEAVVQTFSSIGNFDAYFGGGLTFGLSSAPDFLGVWGNRNSARFRRLLRETLGAIEIIEGAPPARMTTAYRVGSRLNRLERVSQEAALRTGRL